MKNLKKVLSLVLALAMALSLMTAAFAADAGDFADYDSVSHNEAVDVMTAIGVFNGTGNGNNFDPKGTLTREQAAKIIVYMLVGQESGDKLTTLVAPFSDVSADRWSAGAIAYCANAGILAGTGGGKFNPTGELTGLAFSKMLLVALGYNAEKENLTGTAWAINAASLGVSAGLADKLDAVALSGPITREQAAQMAFNAEKATMVRYGSTTTVNTGDNVVTITGDRNWVQNDIATNNNIKADSRMQFAEEYCRDLVCFDDSDAFENPGSSWTIKGADIGTYVDDVDLSYTAEVKYKALKKDMPASVLNNIGDLDYYIDGASAAFNQNDLKNGTDTAIVGTGNGVLTKVFWTYNDDDKDYDVVITSVNTYAMKVVNSEKNDNDKYDIEVDMGDAYKFESTTSFKTDDIVILTWSDKTGETETMKMAESVTGDTTRVRTNNAGDVGERFTIDGNEYQYNLKFDTLSAGDQGKLTANAKNVLAYLDDYGYVVRIDNAETTTDYAVVLGYSKAWSSNTTTRQAQLLLADGSVKTVDVKGKYANGTTIDWDNDLDNEGSVIGYSVNSDGVYTIDTVTKVTNTGLTAAAKIDKGVSKFTVNGGTYFANDKTAFFLYDGSDYSAYVGIKNVPSVETADKITDVTIKTRGSLVDAVYLVSDGNVETGTAGERAAFIYKRGNEKHYDVKDGDRYYTVDAVVNGEATTLDVERSYYGSLTLGGNLVGKLSIKGDIVTNTSAEKVDNRAYGTIFTAAKDGIITIDGTTSMHPSTTGYADGSKADYAYASDAVAYIYDTGDQKFSKRGLTSLRSFDADNVSADTGKSVWVQLDDEIVVAVYYIQP